MYHVANIIRSLHILLIIFVITIPFIDVIWPILALHAMCVITLMLHWVTNRDACVLTILECYFRGIESKKSFAHSLVSPIYNIDDVHVKRLVMTITPILGLISAYRLYDQFPVIISDIKALRAHYKNKGNYNINYNHEYN